MLSLRLQKEYEKPFALRQRVMRARHKRIFGADLKRRIDLVTRVNRADPWPR